MRGWSSAFALVVCCLCSTRAPAYCLRQATDGSYLTWKQQVPYFLSDTVSDPQHRSAIDAAFASWAAISCTSVSFASAGSFSLASTAYDDAGPGIHVFWYDDSTGFPIPAQYVASSVLVHDGQGSIVGASLLVNGFAFDWATDGRPDALDVQAQLTALIGQAIGLDQSNVPDSVMSTPPSYGDLSARSLTADDEAATRFLYPDPSCSAPPAPGSDGCSAGSGSTPPDGTAPPDGGGGCRASSQCGSEEVCTIEGTCVPGDVQQNSGSGECVAFTDCRPGFVCTAERSCVQVGGTTPPPSTNEPQQPSGESPPVEQQRDPTSASGCTHSDQCGPTQVCAAEGICVPIASGTDSGGCRIAPKPTPLFGSMLLLLLLLRQRKKTTNRS